MGTATSRTGFTTQALLDLESAAASFMGTEAAVHLPSGYMGAAAVLASMAQRFDVIFADEASHYAVFDAAAASGKPIHRFGHCDADHLTALLRQHLRHGQRPLVITDGVFALLGDIAPVDRYIAALADCPAAAVYVDDAHGLGVLGDRGRGTLEHHGLGAANRLDSDWAGNVSLWHSATLSKALGGYGGVIAGSEGFVEMVGRSSDLVRGASPLPPMLLAGSTEALRLVRNESGVRTQLHVNVRQVKRGLAAMGLTVDQSPVPIVSVATGDGPGMQRIQQRLLERDIAIAYFGAYSGSKPGGSLRIAVFADHTTEQIDELLSALRAVL
jgi:7-keto-8-aminopelargonate synthetase-like enzyme